MEIFTLHRCEKSLLLSKRKFVETKVVNRILPADNLYYVDKAKNIIRTFYYKKG